MSKFSIGQRWISESEPELGLGTVDHADSNRVQIGFKAAGVTRTYSADHAPLKRVRFRVGDKVKTQAGNEFVVKEVLEQHGLLTYVGENQRLAETDLNDNLSLRGPQERLFAGRFDASQTFELRRRTLELLHRSRKSSVRGFLGGRIDLIPHQLFIAHEVSSRYAPPDTASSAVERPRQSDSRPRARIAAPSMVRRNVAALQHLAQYF
jgi:ATP-dependent helicase HepA